MSYDAVIDIIKQLIAIESETWIQATLVGMSVYLFYNIYITEFLRRRRRKLERIRNKK